MIASYSTLLFCFLLIVVVESKAIASLSRPRRQVNYALSQNLHNYNYNNRNKRAENVNRRRKENNEIIIRGISDFAYLGEIEKPKYPKSEKFQIENGKTIKVTNGFSNWIVDSSMTTENDMISFMDSNEFRFPSVGASSQRVTTRTTTSASTVNPRANEPNACQLRCHRTVTSEYNPRCGSDGVTYYNPGKLDCAKRCGKRISKSTYAACGNGARVI